MKLTLTSYCCFFFCPDLMDEKFEIEVKPVKPTNVYIDYKTQQYGSTDEPAKKEQIYIPTVVVSAFSLPMM